MKQLRRFREVADLTLHATDGELGSVEDLYVDDQTWAIRYLVVKTGGWLLGRAVLVAPVSVLEIDDAGGRLHVNLTREQIQHSPPVDRAKPVSRAYEEAYYRHMRLAPYWDTVPGPARTVTPYPGTVPSTIQTAGIPEDPNLPEHPHLRSVKETTGYAIGAQDGEIGHVEDVVLDDEEWIVRYIEVDTRKWLPGKKVLVQIARIEEINWVERSVEVALTRKAIEAAPAYNPSELITPDYEVQLFKYYSRAAA